MRFAGITLPRGGTLRLGDDGQTLVFVPDPTWPFDETFRYNVTDGFGFTGSVFGEIDRGTGDDEQRDFVYTRSSMDFLVDVTNGLYDVTVLMGDESFLQDNMQLSLEGIIVDTITTTAGNYHQMTYQVTVSDGQLTLGLTALGGTYNNALINSLVISPA